MIGERGRPWDAERGARAGVRTCDGEHPAQELQGTNERIKLVIDLAQNRLLKSPLVHLEQLQVHLRGALPARLSTSVRRAVNSVRKFLRTLMIGFRKE